MQYDKQGKASDAFIPDLVTYDGRVVGRAGFAQSYPHMGRLRCISGSVDAEDARMRSTWRGYLAQIRGFELRAGEFMELANIFNTRLGGLLGLIALYAIFDV